MRLLSNELKFIGCENYFGFFYFSVAQNFEWD